MRYVIVGAGLAAVRAIDAVRQRGYDGELVLIGEERDLPYERPPLSKEVLAGATTPAELQPSSFYRDADVRLDLGRRAVELSRGRVTLDDGRSVSFDKLLIATGAAPRALTVEGAHLDGVVSLRTFADAIDLRARIDRAENVVVVGGGLIGLEVAAAARTRSRNVTIVEQSAHLLERIAGRAGDALTDLHRRNGVHVRTSARVGRIEGDRSVTGVTLLDGSRVPAEVVVVAIGAAPATDWLVGSGVDVSDGILVNEYGETSVPGVFAAGDVARFYSACAGTHVRLETFGNAHGHGLAFGRSMIGAPERYDAVPAASTAQFGARVQTIGDVHRADMIVTRGRVEDDGVLTLFLRGTRVVGAVAVGRPRDFLNARRWVIDGTSLDVNTLAHAV